MMSSHCPMTSSLDRVPLPGQEKTRAKRVGLTQKVNLVRVDKVGSVHSNRLGRTDSIPRIQAYRFGLVLKPIFIVGVGLCSWAMSHTIKTGGSKIRSDFVSR